MRWDINKTLSGGEHMQLKIGMSGIKAMIDLTRSTWKKLTLSNQGKKTRRMSANSMNCPKGYAERVVADLWRLYKLTIIYYLVEGYR